jgi:three-Cys-motif partner protein
VASNRRHFEAFGRHTLLKHAILNAYTKQWAAKLAQFTKADKPLWFVDAFAGAGRDKQGRPGSPLIVGAVARELPTTALGVPSGQTARLDVVAFETSKARFRRLQAAIREMFGDADYIHLRNDTLANRADRLLNVIGAAPMLTFLDPYGLQGINCTLFPRLLKGPRNEVLALVSDEGALRLYGLSRTRAPDFSREREAAAAMTSLFGDESTEELRTAMEAKILQRERGYAGQPRAAKILTEALGDSWVDEFAGVHTEAEIPRRAVDLFCTRLRQAGAAHTTTYPVRDERGKHQYFLVHGTKSEHGVRAMKVAIQHAEKQLGIEREGLFWEIDAHAAVDQVCRHFAGQRVRWTVEKGNRGPNISHYLWVYTELFYTDQFSTVKAELVARGFEVRRRPQEFAFPPAAATSATR